MKYTCEIEINKPRDEVIALFDNPDNMKMWQPGFVSMDLIEGTAGQPGARSKLVYMMGKRPIEMVETITKRNLPDEFSGTYEAKGVWNEVKNFFHEAGPGKTRWVTEQEFRFTGFMKVIGFLMPGAFKKQSMKYLTYFKTFAETGKAAV